MISEEENTPLFLCEEFALGDDAAIPKIAKASISRQSLLQGLLRFARNDPQQDFLRNNQLV